jgi:DNA-binding IclR family transcriptional regulator
MPELFPITPASVKPLWFLGGICVVLGAVLLVLAYTAYSARHSRVEIDDDHLRVVGDLWGRSVPLDALDVDGAQVLDLAVRSDYAPSRRTMGTGLPGYASGWFRLRNGEKALAYLTDWERVAYIPTSEGYALLLSVPDPARLIERVAVRRQLRR